MIKVVNCHWTRVRKPLGDHHRPHPAMSRGHAEEMRGIDLSPRQQKSPHPSLQYPDPICNQPSTSQPSRCQGGWTWREFIHCRTPYYHLELSRFPYGCKSMSLLSHFTPNRKMMATTYQPPGNDEVLMQ